MRRTHEAALDWVFDMLWLLLCALAMLAIVVGTVALCNYSEARDCHIAQQQYHRHTHYVTLSACYIDTGDGRRVRLDSYTPIVRAR